MAAPGHAPITVAVEGNAGVGRPATRRVADRDVACIEKVSDLIFLPAVRLRLKFIAN